MHTDRHQTDRRNAILRLLRGSPVRRQSDLVSLLKRDGFEVTQSSISRDMRELGVLKTQGRYLPPDAEIAPAAGAFSAVDRFVRAVTPAGPSLTVVRTTVGAAGSVAAAIDRAAWPEVIGTIAGDDTIFIATQDASSQAGLLARLRTHFRI